MSQLRLTLSFAAICLLLMSSPASAHPSIVFDPVGDFLNTTNPPPPYYDIVMAKVQGTGSAAAGNQMLVFSMHLAVPIPELSSDTFYGANWLLETNSAHAGPDYNVIVRWCTRTPTLTTHPKCKEGPAHWEGALNNFSLPPSAPQTEIRRFVVDGDHVQLWLDPSLIGSPSTFVWQAATRSRGAQPNPEDSTEFATFER